MSEMKTMEQALAELGDTPEEVAQHLREQGIRGVLSEAWSCPIARYVERTTGLTDVCADPDYIQAVATGQGYVDCDVPDAVSDFINRFDRREFPDLIETEAGS